LVHIVRAEKTYRPNLGDVWPYGLDQWLRKLDKKRQKEAPGVFLLAYVGHNAWRALETLGINAEDLLKDSQYKCPITERSYNAILPRYILTDDLQRYLPSVPDWAQKMASDMEWVRGILKEDGEEESDAPGRIEQCLLGPGYGDCILPCDGSAHFDTNMVRLSNGDDLVCLHYEWFNK
jgi:hypothetical protein